MKLLKNLAASLILTLAACADQSSRSIESQLEAAGLGIQGGELVSKNSDPVTAQVKDVLVMLRQPGYEPNCGGVLIAPKVVLTAAHCLINLHSRSGWLPAKSLRIGVCIDQKDQGCSWSSIKSYIIHENYHLMKTKDKKAFKKELAGNTLIKDGIEDIALLFLNKEIPVKDYVPLGSSTPRVSDNLFIYGSGRTHKTGKEEGLYRTVKLKADRVFNYTGGEDLLGKFLALHTSDQGICAGDSGGPLFAYQDNQLVVAALSSSGLPKEGNYPCGDWATLVTDISYYLKWIKENAGPLLESSHTVHNKN